MIELFIAPSICFLEHVAPVLKCEPASPSGARQHPDFSTRRSSVQLISVQFQLAFNFLMASDACSLQPMRGGVTTILQVIAFAPTLHPASIQRVLRALAKALSKALAKALTKAHPFPTSTGGSIGSGPIMPHPVKELQSLLPFPPIAQVLWAAWPFLAKALARALAA